MAPPTSRAKLTHALLLFYRVLPSAVTLFVKIPVFLVFLPGAEVSKRSLLLRTANADSSSNAQSEKGWKSFRSS